MLYKTSIVHSVIYLNATVQLHVCNTLFLIIIWSTAVWGGLWQMWLVCMHVLFGLWGCVWTWLLFYWPLQAHYSDLMTLFFSFYSVSLYCIMYFSIIHWRGIVEKILDTHTKSQTGSLWQERQTRQLELCFQPFIKLSNPKLLKCLNEVCSQLFVWCR